ncbi:MAG: hypothetical protein D6B25_11000 [Desulfobulbaceae bacterium]|nr:MAG: hypothetical protein D6B25_11000 [Desulfobulbaceae bacterium]
MATKKSLIDNELMKEIITIRTDTLFRMLEQEKIGYFPGADEEGATGRYDNKGAIFIPGGLVYQDVDERFIRYESFGKLSGGEFRQKIREAMRYDNATLLYPDGIAASINLDGGFFSKAARRIYTYKRAAYRRVKRISNNNAIEITADDIIKSHCPTYLRPPYGARTRISTCISVGLIDQPMYFAYNKTELNFSHKQSQRFIDDLDRTRDHAISSDDTILYPPCIVVCHDTRYKENNFTGLTRILGIGNFGEFATFTFEAYNKQLSSEIKRKKISFCEDDWFAIHQGIPIYGILRIYARTNPGKRSKQYSMHVISPEDDIGLNLQRPPGHGCNCD